jgi:hypothetical protein
MGKAMRTTRLPTNQSDYDDDQVRPLVCRGPTQTANSVVTACRCVDLKPCSIWILD